MPKYFKASQLLHIPLFKKYSQTGNQLATGTLSKYLPLNIENLNDEMNRFRTGWNPEYQAEHTRRRRRWIRKVTGLKLAYQEEFFLAYPASSP